MENYQVLARKYRPQNFSDVVGQDPIVTTLKNALRLKKISHAYLFAGSRGTGKTTLARIFSKSLNCSNLKEDQEPCNACPSCIDILNGQSMDVMEIDGASNRGIDDIRQINEMVGYLPTNGKYKIYIIDEVHMLTKEAFNALLKTLEEPPPTAKFFFATTEPHKVLPTILSRCQRFDLGRISQSGILRKLEEIAGDLSRTVSPEALFKIADMADGSLRDAESLFDQVLCFTEKEVTLENVREIFGLVSKEHFFELDRAFSRVHLPFAFELIESLYQSGKDLSHFMTQLIEHYRYITLAKTVGQSALPEAIAPDYLEAATHYTKHQTLYLLEYLIQSQEKLQKTLSARIFLETTLLHIIRSKNRIPVEVIARRLSELEGKYGPSENESPKPTLSRLSQKEETSINQEETVSFHEPESQIKKGDPLPLEKESASIKTASPSTESPLSVPKLSTVMEKKDPNEANETETGPENPSKKREQSDYDTLIRFAAVELEASFKT